MSNNSKLNLELELKEHFLVGFVQGFSFGIFGMCFFGDGWDLIGFFVGGRLCLVMGYDVGIEY